MKMSSVLLGVALASACVSHVAFGSQSEYLFTYLTKLERIGSSGTDKGEVIKVETVSMVGGQPGGSALWQQLGEPEKIVDGDTTTLRSVFKRYGYSLTITSEAPESAVFEKNGQVKTAISYEQSLKGADGQPVNFHAAKNASLAVGSPTTLEWSNDGKSYRLTVELSKSEPLTFD